MNRINTLNRPFRAGQGESPTGYDLSDGVDRSGLFGAAWYGYTSSLYVVSTQPLESSESQFWGLWKIFDCGRQSVGDRLSLIRN